MSAHQVIKTGAYEISDTYIPTNVLEKHEKDILISYGIPYNSHFLIQRFFYLLVYMYV